MQDLRFDLEDDYGNEEPAELPVNFDEIEAQQEEERLRKEPPPKFLGMTAGERAFVSMMFFFIVLIFGAAILAVTERIQL